MSGRSVTTPEEAARLARGYQVEGYDLIKTHEGLSREVYEALAASAAEVGIPFGGHVPDAVGLLGALAAGQVSIDHLDNYVEALVPEDARDGEGGGLLAAGALVDRVDEGRIPELVRATVDAGAWVVPTMVLWETAFFGERPSADIRAERPEVRYMPPETVERWAEAVDTRLEGSDPEANRRVAELRRRILAGAPGGRRADCARHRLAADLLRARLRDAPRDGALRRRRHDTRTRCWRSARAVPPSTSTPRPSSARWRWIGAPT